MWTEGAEQVGQDPDQSSKETLPEGETHYEHERMSLDILRRFHEVLKPFLEKELNIDVKLENDAAVISLPSVKTFRYAENTPGKTHSKTS